MRLASLSVLSVLSLIVLVIVTSAAALAQDDAPERAAFRGRADRTGNYLAASLYEQPARLWNFETPRQVRASIALAEGVAVAGNEAGEVYALDAATGDLVWTFEAARSVASSAALDTRQSPGAGVSFPPTDTVFVGSHDGSLYALDLATGALVWRFETGGEVYSAPLVIAGQVVFGSRDTFVYALDAATGVERWRFETAGEVWSSAALSGDHVVIGTRGGAVYALNLADGALVWTADTAGVDAVPAVRAGVVYVGDYDGTLYALDAATGAPLWTFAVGSAVYASAALGVDANYADRLYITGLDGTLYALDTATGDAVWRFDMGGPAYSSPSLSCEATPVTRFPVCDTLYIVTEADGLLYALDATTGVERWRIVTGAQGDWRASSPVVYGETLYVGSNSYGVMAWR